jgi:hypothetical protein
MKIPMVVLLAIVCNSLLGQGTQAGGDIYFRAGVGEQLVEVCRAGDEVTHNIGGSMPTKDLLEDFHKEGTCDGFIQGILDYETITTTDKDGRPAGRHFCVPAEASSAQLTKVVVKYGDNHPAQLHFPAASIVLLAMKDAFPCR